MNRPSPAILVAVVALVLAGTSTSFAAGALITSKQIKNGTIKVKDISPKARAALSGKTGPTGPQGPAGTAGTAGAPGPRGYSAWDTIPPGTLVRGGWDADSSAESPAMTIVALPGLPPTPLDVEHIVVVPDAHCTVHADFAVSPDAGYLCVEQLTKHWSGGSEPTVTAGPYYDGGMVRIALDNLTGSVFAGAEGGWYYRAP